MVKGEAHLKISHSILEYNDFSVAQNISVNVISFMGDRPLEGRLWIFKILQVNPMAWPEIQLFSNPIEMQKYFSQEENRHAIWNTTSKTNLTTVEFPRLAVVPYEVVEWISKKGRTPNELRLCYLCCVIVGIVCRCVPPI